jgi:maltooligosyltrehalose trehalohydrolase
MRDPVKRRLPVGAEVQADGSVHFRVWAPRRRVVEVVLEGRPEEQAGLWAVTVLLEPEADGYFSGRARGVPAGSLYRFRLDGALFPDPASRFQPQGVHGPSQVIDPTTFAWTDLDWRGVGREGQILYEMHVGTYTSEGTWQAAIKELPHLAALGVTILEVMPVAEFPGRFGWGYDGVDLFAPSHLYGQPDEFRRFVDRAHAAGLGVILDVVYNHFGPDGNYLGQFASHYVTDRYSTEWGEAVNFDGDDSGPVREFFLANAGYWVEEFHLDGLRLDATQRIYDPSGEHILAAIGRRVREAARGRATFVSAEADHQEARIARPPESGGFGLDAVWNDDFHHSARVALTGRRESYYSRYRGTPQELLSAVKWGFLYQGQRTQAPLTLPSPPDGGGRGKVEGGQRTPTGERRGTPAFDLHPAAFVTFLENHDQVANSADGRRLHALADPGCYRALTALWLLSAGTPLLFQGQEFASSRPWVFFADHHEELAKLVAKGRNESLSQFPSIATLAVQAGMLAPHDPVAFQRSKLDLSERERHVEAYALHRDLIELRRTDPVFGRRRPGAVDGAVLGSETLLVRFFGGGAGDRVLLVNLGRDLDFDPAAEPLLAPPEGQAWRVAWSSEDPRYGGCGTPPVCGEFGWRLPGHAAVLVAPSEPDA